MRCSSPCPVEKCAAAALLPGRHNASPTPAAEPRYCFLYPQDPDLHRQLLQGESFVTGQVPPVAAAFARQHCLLLCVAVHLPTPMVAWSAPPCLQPDCEDLLEGQKCYNGANQVQCDGTFPTTAGLGCTTTNALNQDSVMMVSAPPAHAPSASELPALQLPPSPPPVCCRG